MQKVRGLAARIVMCTSVLAITTTCAINKHLPDPHVETIRTRDEETSVKTRSKHSAFYSMIGDKKVGEIMRLLLSTDIWEKSGAALGLFDAATVGKDISDFEKELRKIVDKPDCADSDGSAAKALTRHYVNRKEWQKVVELTTHWQVRFDVIEALVVIASGVGSENTEKLDELRRFSMILTPEYDRIRSNRYTADITPLFDFLIEVIESWNDSDSRMLAAMAMQIAVEKGGDLTGRVATLESLLKEDINSEVRISLINTIVIYALRVRDKKTVEQKLRDTWSMGYAGLAVLDFYLDPRALDSNAINRHQTVIFVSKDGEVISTWDPTDINGLRTAVIGYRRYGIPESDTESIVKRARLFLAHI